jgi:carboxyl-terminal processing protease
LIRLRRSFGSGLMAGFALGLLVAVAALVVYALVGEDDDPVTKARAVIEDNYFEDPSADVLDQASIRGMIDELRKRYDDKFSHYFDPEQAEAFESSTSGRFSGVGLSVTEVPRGLRVARVFPDTPAEREGLEVGDLIVGVNGESIEGVSSDVSTAKIKGPPGTEVELRVDPVGAGQPRDITLERADVRIPAVQGDILRSAGHRVAYVYFASFSQGAHGDLLQEIERLFREGAEGLVLDLRGNGGGLLNEAVLCASIFIEKGVIVSTESRTQGDRTYEATGDAIDPQPTVVLVDRNTASAAEILAAAMKFYDVATVVGTRTYGKGTFQEVIGLPDGGALDLTIGQYLPADGKSILGTGVKPEAHAKDDPKTKYDQNDPRAAGKIAHPKTDEGLQGALHALDEEL